MKEKIKQFLSEQNLTAAQLADQIGVQRSSVSHILTGRNKPSFDFITKFCQAYPEINANWLLGASDNMLLTQRSKSNNLFSSVKNEDKAKDKATMVSGSTESGTGTNTIPPPETVENVDIQNKKVHKVVFFYDDLTFLEYFPR